MAEEQQKVIVACPQCKQRLRCVAGGAGTCPKCGTRVEFPESIYAADPELNKEELARLAGERLQTTIQDMVEPPEEKKKGGIVKKIIIIVVALVLVIGLVIGGLVVKNIFFSSDDKQEDSSSQTDGEGGGEDGEAGGEAGADGGDGGEDAPAE